MVASLLIEAKIASVHKNDMRVHCGLLVGRKYPFMPSSCIVFSLTRMNVAVYLFH